MNMLRGFVVLGCTLTMAVSKVIAQTPTDKTTLNGQVFIVTNGGENIKLGLVHVRLFSLDQANAIIESVKKSFNDSKSDNEAKLDSILKLCIEDQSKVHALFPKMGTSEKLDEKALQAAMDKENADRVQYEVLLRKYEYPLTQDYLLSALTSPAADEETDADGKFTMLVPKQGSWVLQASASRITFNKPESYFWYFKLTNDELAKGKIFLSNDNLTTEHFAETVCNPLSPLDLDKMVTIKLNELDEKEKAETTDNATSAPAPTPTITTTAPSPTFNVPLPDFNHTTRPDTPAVDSNGLPVLPKLDAPTTNAAP